MTLACAMSCHNADKKKVIEHKSLQKNLIGLWGGLEESEPVWEIKTDSIYYFGEQQSYGYKLYGDSLVVNYKEGQFYLKNISVIEDTLIFFDDLGMKTFAYRKGK